MTRTLTQHDSTGRAMAKRYNKGKISFIQRTRRHRKPVCVPNITQTTRAIPPLGECTSQPIQALDHAMAIKGSVCRNGKSRCWRCLVETCSEHRTPKYKRFSGADADIFKWLYLISRPLMYKTARAAEMPIHVIDAYARYQEHLDVYNSLALGLRKPHKRPCGIPQ